MVESKPNQTKIIKAGGKRKRKKKEKEWKFARC